MHFTCKSLFKHSDWLFLAARWRALRPGSSQQSEKESSLLIINNTEWMDGFESPTNTICYSEVCPVSDDDLQTVQPTQRHTEVEPARGEKARCAHHVLPGVHFRVTRSVTYADLPSPSSLVGQRPFFIMRAATFSGSFCSTACRSLSSLLLQSWLWEWN